LRSQASGATPGSVLCDALLRLSASYTDDLARLLVRKQVIAATPSLRTRALERRSNWEDGIVDELRARFPDGYSSLQLRVTVAAVSAALSAAVDVWLETGGLEPFTNFVRAAFDHVSTGLEIAAS
ncbi:MAG: MftR C-terminal domain, partial [Ilumatobacteraceae bacterium]|nr:MftR C-terminal domain [Ilumatobacteraceae bacterium]